MSPGSLTNEENSPTSDEEQFETIHALFIHNIKEKKNIIST